MAFQAPPTTTLLLLVLVVLTHCLSIRCVVVEAAQTTDGSSNVSLVEEAALGWTTFMADDEHGRILYGRKANRRGGYYISYAALAANHIPCPAGSGRSYYTNNCYRANRAVNPYARGCSCITHCRRG